ncbi:MAG: cryptochrome/photolyase family protein [Pirellulaceae bacterium]
MNHTATAVVYPHQLWEDNPVLREVRDVVLVEDPLFFSQYNFHRQKLVLHRASMTEFAMHCQSKGIKVQRIEAHELTHSADIGAILAKKQVKQALAVDPADTWLRARLSRGCRDVGVALTWLDDPAFLTPSDAMRRWVENRDHYHFTDFYIQQRKRLGILIGVDGKPVGGKWTYDTENRKKLPKHISVPEIFRPAERKSVSEAKRYVAQRFPQALGKLDDFCYPVTYRDARLWLDEFIATRLAQFGDYEDAISSNQTFVFHSVLTPMLNIGLLTPQQIIDATTDAEDAVPLNSLEGFLRQVIGWREFIRLVYLQAGTRQRTCNAWKLSRKLPAAFYDGTTGIDPLDHVIHRVLDHAYCHHIERLMILGNFMLLCDVTPDAVYQWFMEMFIDSYDWVMVPNVYGMSQHADGGLMTTKPYISGSSYIRKMSDYSKGPWTEIWDGLYWRFIDREREFFSSNPRMRVMVGQLDRMGEKLTQHKSNAERFLEELHA